MFFRGARKQSYCRKKNKEKITIYAFTVPQAREWTSEWCEQRERMSELTSKWSITSISILGCCGPQRNAIHFLPWKKIYSYAPQYRTSRDQQISYVIGGFSLLPIKEIKRNDLKGPKLSIRYWRISVTLGSGIAGFNCTNKRWNCAEAEKQTQLFVRERGKM